jgi:hypothetical protein
MSAHRVVPHLKFGAPGALLWLALIATVSGILTPSALLLAVAAACVGCAVVVYDVRRLKRGTLTPMSFFALAFAISGVANAVGVQSLAERGNQSPFDLYVAMDYLYFACAVMLAGGMAIIGGFYTAGRWHTWRLVARTLPKISARVDGRELIYGGIIITVLSTLVSHIVGAYRLGTVSGLIALVPDLTVFAISRLGAARKSRRMIVVALGLSMAVAVHAALFAYLRSDILLPIFALLCGLIVGSRSLAILRRRILIPVYCVIGLFAVNFAALGRIRSTTSEGESRVEALRAASTSAVMDSTDDSGGLLIRLSTLNQLSQVGLLANEGGFLHGQTLEYLGFAFVPRFLWRGKPKIAKGSWFAYRIGQALIRPDGSFTNSINMTVPGELFLNFGWGGVLIGSYFFGVLLSLFWSTAMFWTADNNPLGTAFGFYLLWIGIGLVADLQIVVTLFAMYLLFLACSLGMSGLRYRRLIPSTARASAGALGSAGLRT